LDWILTRKSLYLGQVRPVLVFSLDDFWFDHHGISSRVS
jgi:hypothetical protein